MEDAEGVRAVNLTQNPDKTTCTLFTPDPEEYKSNLDLKINNTVLPMARHPKVLGPTLDPNSYTMNKCVALVAEWLRVRLRVRMVKGSTLTVGNFLSLENLNVIIRAIN